MYMTSRYVFTCGEWLATDRGRLGETQIHLTAIDEHLVDNNVLLKELGKRHMFDDHLWFSLSRRPNCSKFTRVQRLWSLAALFFLSMITSAMFFKAESPDISEMNLKIGPFKLTYKQFYVGLVSSLVTIVPSIIIVAIFRKRQIKGTELTVMNSDIKHKTDEPKEPSNDIEKDPSELSASQLPNSDDNLTVDCKQNKKRRQCKFPWWTIFIAYGLISCSIITSGFFLFMYSLEWGKEITEEWMLTIMMCTVQSIFLVEPTKVHVLSYNWFETNLMLVLLV